VEDGDQQPHSVSLESSQRIEKSIAVDGLDERLEGRGTPREAGKAGKPREVICCGVGITQQTKDKPHRSLVEGRVFEAIGVGGRGHGETPETGNLSVWNRNAATDTGREDRFSLEQACDHQLTRVDELGLLEELTKEPEELRPIPDVGRDQHHRRVQLL
jgi:hypothetical protein